MDFPDHELVSTIMNCVHRLLREDGELLVLGAHEQAVSARLAIYLQKECNGLKVDPEYNRHAGKTKQAVLSTGRKNIVPDIVVHSRGDDESNQAVIEVKLSGRGTDADRAHARDKLYALVHGDEFRYKLGLLLELGLIDGVPSVVSAEWYLRDLL